MAISQGSSQGRGALFTEINITPLTDIFLVLLIIMMVIAPMFENSKADIKIPSIASGQGLEEHKVTVEISKEGQFYANGTAVTAGNMDDRLKALLSETGQKSLVVRADQATATSEVMKVFESASRVGFEKLTIAGEPLSGKRQTELQAPPATGETP